MFGCHLVAEAIVVVHGKLVDEDGCLMASFSQEGTMRRNRRAGSGARAA
jgi:acyl-CoA thioesterase